MRLAPTVLLLFGFSSACNSIPGLDDPGIRIQPRIWFDAANGDAGVSGPPVSGVPPGGSQIPLAELAQQGRDEDIGVVTHLGDGFSGIEFYFQQVDIQDSVRTVLPSTFGRVPAGSTINSNLGFDEFRLGYVGEVFGHEFEFGPEDEEEYVNLRLGAGLELTHRDGDFEVIEEVEGIGPTGVVESLDFSDNGVVYGKVRGRVSWRQFALQFDFAYSPNLTFGGDLEGDHFDTEIQGRYTLFDQDLSLIVGYRRSTFGVTRSETGFQSDADFQIDGVFLGLEVGF